MGGLFKPLKITAILMCIGSLALAGIYPFAGFFSKDLILGYSFISFHHGIFSALNRSFLTAFYSFRLLMLVFLPLQDMMNIHMKQVKSHFWL